MVAKIFSLSGQPVDGLANGEPCKDVVEVMEHFLTDARSGKLQAVGIVGLGTGDETAMMFAGAASMPRLVGALEIAKLRLVLMLEESLT